MTRLSTCCSAWGRTGSSVPSRSWTGTSFSSRFFLESLDQDIFNAVKAWGEMRKRLEAGEITELEYVTWRDGYTAKKQVG